MASTWSSAEVMLYMHESAAKCVATSGQCTLSFATALAEKHRHFWYPRSTVVGAGDGVPEGAGDGAPEGSGVGGSEGSGVGSIVGV